MLVLSAWCLVLALLAACRGSLSLSTAARHAASGAAGMATLALLVLLHAFAVGDHTLRAVQHYSEADMPMFYRLTAIWGGQEGSLLFWAWLLALHGALFLHVNRHRLRGLLPWTTTLLMTVQVFFGVLLLLTANPFDTFLTEVPAEGQGLNPLLQNPFMVTHPPALYIGYVGMTIPFALAMAALISGRTGQAWVAAARPFALFAWYALGLGLVLGMLWAYEELGWGGYWGWDPVENAALIPWLTSTAYLHSARALEQRQSLKVWTLVLAVLTFELTIFGTFLTRSGFIQSVHAFARSAIGWYFLGFMVVVLVSAMALLLYRRRRLASPASVETAIGREAFFTLNNWMFIGASFLTLVLTIFPSLSSVLGDQVTISPAAFNRWMAPIGLALLFSTGFGPLFPWQARGKPSSAQPGTGSLATEPGSSLRRRLVAPLAIGGVTLLLMYALGVRRALPLATLALAALALGTAVQDIGRGLLASRRHRGHSRVAAAGKALSRSRRRYGAQVVHAGIALMYIGFAGEAFKIEQDVTLRRGQRVTVGEYQLEFKQIREHADRQKQMITAVLELRQGGQLVGALEPARWIYKKHEDQPTTEVAIRRALREDLFVALGAYEPNGSGASFKVIVNPLVNWIWIGFAVLSVGLIMAFEPRRVQVPMRAASGTEPDGPGDARISAPLLDGANPAMRKIEQLLFFLLPAGIGAAAAWAGLSAGGLGDSVSLLLLVLGGAALGLTLVQVLRSTAHLLGLHRPPPEQGSGQAARREQLAQALALAETRLTILVSEADASDEEAHSQEVEAARQVVETLGLLVGDGARGQDGRSS